MNTPRDRNDRVFDPAVTEHLAELEDIYLAERVLERVRSGKEDTVELDEMITRYAVED